MVTARFKPARTDTPRHMQEAGAAAVPHRILCGTTDARGCQSCRGELGVLFSADQCGKFFLPLVYAATGKDAHGAYRLGRQRRPFLSGMEGSSHVGAGVATDPHLLRDAYGQARKFLHLFSERAGHDRLVIVCPRCSTANEIAFGDFLAYLERAFAPH